MNGIEEIKLGDDITLFGTIVRRNLDGELEPVDLTDATSVRFRAQGRWNGVDYGFSRSAHAEGGGLDPEQGITILSPTAGTIQIKFGGTSWDGFPTLRPSDALDLTPEIETVTPDHGRETPKLRDPADPSSVGIVTLRVRGQLLTP